jgi:OPA family sugar phosphate sensor protein UhpC-like MFS transporter
MKILAPAPHLPEIQDQNLLNTHYNYWRIRIFSSMFIGYVFYYFTRLSFTFTLPSLMADLHFTKSDLGIVMSVSAISYGFSKFISGIIGDRSNARVFMSIGLFITGLCNILFGCFSSLWMFVALWAVNGWFQGFGWPACARLLTHWYSQSERGRWWGFWNSSQNIGGAIIPILTAIIAQHYGWRAAMIFPGMMSIIMSFILWNRLADTPQSLGLPTIEKFRNDYASENAKNQKERELSVKEILFTYVFNNPYIWILAFSYFFVYLVRIAINQWSALYFFEAKGYSQVESSGFVFWYDIGGIFGSLMAGWASDKIFKGRRGPMMVIFSLCTAVVLISFSTYSEKALLIDSALLFMTGFFIFGPQMLIGMAAAELSHKKAAATASGFSGWMGYLGAAVAGYPMGKIQDAYGWSGFFTILIISAFIAGALLLPLWKIRSREEKKSPVPESKAIEEAEPQLEPT